MEAVRADMPMPMPTARRTASPLRLMLQTAGTPIAFAGKLGRLVSVVFGYTNRRRLRARLERLQQRGHIETIPTNIQLIVGSVDLLRFWIVPAAEDYYRSLGIDFRFHQILRFLDEPAGLVDPLGLYSTSDGIIGHLMQVVHANPVYDLQMLDLFEHGLDDLESQLQQMMNGTHPRSQAISAIVEEPDYHAQLLDFVRRWRRDTSTPALLRENIAASPRYRELERTFGQLPTVMRYFCRLPSTWGPAIRHLRFGKFDPG